MFGGFKYLIKTRRGTLELESCDTVCPPPGVFSVYCELAPDSMMDSSYFSWGEAHQCGS